MFDALATALEGCTLESWGGSGGEAGTAAKHRQREVGCFPAHAAEAANEVNMSDAEAWGDETNKQKEAPVALIVRLPSGSACHDSRRLLTRYHHSSQGYSPSSHSLAE